MKAAAIIALSAAGLVAGAIAAAYLAGVAFFIICKSMPDAVAVDTWYRYWSVYGDDPLQRKRLLIAAAVAGAIVLAVPLMALVSLSRQARSLHGDARWASGSEIRKAGLL